MGTVWRLPWRETLDRRILGGRLYLGSTLWAGAHLGLGLLLWGVGAYVHRGGVDPRWLLVTLLLVCVALLVRRAAPGRGLLLGTVVLVVEIVFLGPSSSTPIIYGDLLYAVGAWGRRRLALVAFAIVLVGNALVVVVAGYLLLRGFLVGGLLTLLQLLGLYVLMFTTPAISGLSIREHRLRADLERQRARQIERMAELDRINAIAEERGRMARELHDVIANHLSAVAVQSTAALSMREFDPEVVRRVLGVVRDSSVQGLAEMRRMIGVLRSDDNPDLERVTPRLAEVERLVDTVRRAGLEVTLTETGPSVPLPVQVDAAAYRIVQESLTNALRYADPKQVEVTVERPSVAAVAEEGGRLVLTVENGLPAEGTVVERGDLGAGTGLTGMRERATLLGGTFSAGPVDGRRWRVRAVLPVEPWQG
ncbi:sensor histidine kinase [Marinactinospora thermotolerans]|uniref:sensor histidine kinase n=1 Tax=Marinactinospora thermotolerans TaxID=531310 RepID=UPI003D8EA140